MQGGVLELAQQIKMKVEKEGPPDAILATDMVNLPALIALARPWLNKIPIHLYAHENQLTYPIQPGVKRDLTYSIINTLSMITADAVHFNSDYHRNAFFSELPRLLKHFPDYNHLELIPQLKKKSDVLPVGLELNLFDSVKPRTRKHGPLRILWNQRWEYDKNPGEFFQIMYALDSQGLDFQLILVGKNYRQHPVEFDQARERLKNRIIHFGFVEDRRDYARLLWQADVVLSTAVHEFFGISVLEAVYCGAHPLLPYRLSYPELFAGHLHEHIFYVDTNDAVRKLRWAITHPTEIRSNSIQHVAKSYRWENIIKRYDRCFT